MKNESVLGRGKVASLNFDIFDHATLGYQIPTDWPIHRNLCHAATLVKVYVPSLSPQVREVCDVCTCYGTKWLPELHYSLLHLASWIQTNNTYTGSPLPSWIIRITFPPTFLL